MSGKTKDNQAPQSAPKASAKPAGEDQERVQKLAAEVQAIEEQAQALKESEKRPGKTPEAKESAPKSAEDKSSKAKAAPRSAAPLNAAGNEAAAVKGMLLERDLKALRSRTAFLSALTVLLTACCVGGGFYLSQNVSKVTADSQTQLQAVADSNKRAEELIKALSAQNDRIETLVKRNEELSGINSKLQSSAGALDGKIADAQEQIVGIQSQLKRYEERNPDDWKVAQAYFMVNNAFQMAVFSGDVTSAQWCLKDADSMLEGIEDPDLLKVRQAISADLVKLANLPAVDRRGIGFKLDSVYENLDAMPLAQDGAGRKFAQAPEQPASEPTWRDNLMNSVQSFISRFIEVRHRDDPAVTSYLTADQAAVLRQNIRSLLLLSKQSLFDADQAAFKNNVQQTEDLIRTYCDTQDKVTRANLDALASVRDLPITVDVPSVLTSYTLFREIARSRINLAPPKNTAEAPQADNGGTESK